MWEGCPDGAEQDDDGADRQGGPRSRKPQTNPIHHGEEEPRSERLTASAGRHANREAQKHREIRTGSIHVADVRHAITESCIVIDEGGGADAVRDQDTRCRGDRTG